MSEFVEIEIQSDVIEDKLQIQLFEIEALYKYSYAFSRCMRCGRKPTHEVLWANGKGHAWFCKQHLKQFVRSHLSESKKRGYPIDIDVVKEVDKKASNRIRDNRNPDILKQILKAYKKYEEEKRGKRGDKLELKLEGRKEDKKINEEKFLELLISDKK